MTLYEFRALDEMEQQEAIWERVHIADGEDAEHRILLYQIDGFCVEVYYHKEHNVLRPYGSFNSVVKLGRYLNLVKVG